MISRNGKNLKNGDFDWQDALIDSAIMGGLTFFAALGGTAVAEIPQIKSLGVALIAGFTQFFMTLAVKRGLREKYNQFKER